MPNHHYNRGKQDYKSHINLGYPMLKWSINNINDFTYSYCIRVISSKIPSLSFYVKSKLEEKEH